MKTFNAIRRKLFQALTFVCFVLAFVKCDDSDDVIETVCEKTISITKVLPNRNPISAPVLIIGKNFTADTKVTFNEVESETEFINDSTLTTRPPIELKSTAGLIELSVIEENCSYTTGFTITKNFEDADRASPPNIFFPDPAKKVFVNIKDTLAAKGGYPYYWFNVWGERHGVSFVSTDEYDEQVLTGYEQPRFLGVSNTLWARVDKDRKSIKLKIYYNQNDVYSYTPIPGDHLEGGFYKTTIQTPTGLLSRTFLFLQSTISGRQYIFYSTY